MRPTSISKKPGSDVVAVPAAHGSLRFVGGSHNCECCCNFGNIARRISPSLDCGLHVAASMCCAGLGLAAQAELEAAEASQVGRLKPEVDALRKRAALSGG